jgi:hypothetical protein
MDEFQERDSKWTLIIIHHLEININQYKPLRGSNYIALPEEIIRKKACVNVKNDDSYCFKWAIISALYPVQKHSDRVSIYAIADINVREITSRNNKHINFGELKFPLQVEDVTIFENLNDDISVNVFGPNDKNAVIGPFYCTKLEKQLHINFLFLQEEEKSHYVWIKSISRLLKSQITENHRQIYMYM